MTGIIITTVSVLGGVVALVLVTRQYFAYRASKTHAEAAVLAQYRELVERLDRHTIATTSQLSELTVRVTSVEDLLRSVE